jgi:hypothetical protein
MSETLLNFECQHGNVRILEFHWMKIMLQTSIQENFFSTVLLTFIHCII